MLKIKKLSEMKQDEINVLFSRFGADFSSVMIETVIPIVNDVKENGDEAVKKYTNRFDGASLDSIIATSEEIDEGFSQTPEDVIDAFKKAKANIEEFHSHQIRKEISYTRENFGELGVLYQPIQSAGIYVPGGKAAYPSSVLMGVIPAQIAGVENISVITPPDSKGKVNNSVLAMCKLLGINSVIKSGGAQGIAAAGLGTETVRKSEIIVGPGNIFVTAAKSYLFSLGAIQIDSLAGPSEVLIIADDSANHKWLAWDLLSQAEHEERAMGILLTDSESIALNVQEDVNRDIESGIGRHAIKKAAIDNNSLIILVDSLDDAVKFSNNFAPEHLQVITKDPKSLLHKLKNVGSMFLGEYSPVAVGDYFSGTNHVLPTGGACRFSSGLSVETFYRRTTYQYLTKAGLLSAKDPINIMSSFEGFDDKHGDSVNIRFRNE